MSDDFVWTFCNTSFAKSDSLQLHLQRSCTGVDNSNDRSGSRRSISFPSNAEKICGILSVLAILFDMAAYGFVVVFYYQQKLPC